MIKIISGTYGHKNERGIVEPKTADDAPFQLDKAAEARLVKRGVAKYVDNAQKPAQGADGDDSGNSNTGGGGGKLSQAITLGSLNGMNKAAQEAIAKRRGVDLSTAKNREERAKLIWDDIQSKGDNPKIDEYADAIAETADGNGGDGADGDGGENPPDLSAGGPVM